MTSWNALTGIALLHAYRSGVDERGLEKSKNLFQKLTRLHYHNGCLAHSSLDGQIQTEEFLEDYASLFLFSTYLFEEDESFGETMLELRDKTLKYREGIWVEASNIDFMKIPAQEYDQPTPGSVSVAEMALLRAAILTGESYETMKFKYPVSCDFHNLTCLISNGYFHEIHVPEKIDWSVLLVSSLQIRSERIQLCNKGKCREYDSIVKLLSDLEI